MTEIRQVLDVSHVRLRGEVLHLDQGYVRRIFYERAKDVDLPKELLSPRVIRHSRGIELLRGDVPLKIVQQFLGQQSPTLTASYLHFSREDARKIVHSHIRREAMKKPAPATRSLEPLTASSAATCSLKWNPDLHRPSGRLHHHAESADNLELREGINTTATIKAPWVIISTGDAPTSARNHFSGKVQSVQLGEIEAEVLVTLDEGTPSAPSSPPRAPVCSSLSPAARVRPVQGVWPRFGDVNEDLVGGGRGSLSARKALPLHPPKTFRLYRIPVADFPKIRKKDMRLEAELPLSGTAGAGTAFGIPSGGIAIRAVPELFIHLIRRATQRA